MVAEPEDSDDQPVPEGLAPQVVRKRGARDPFRDLVIPFLAIAAVVGAIVLVQLYRARDRVPALDASFAPGAYQAIDLGPAGGGKPKLGEPAPGFQLLDPEGNLIRLDDFRGRPVVVNFWATWCVPCQRESPDLVALQKEWGDSVRLLGVDYFESAEAVKGFALNFSLNYPLPLDSDGRVTGSYKLTGLPETFFLDDAGIIRDHRIGQLRPEIARCIVAGIQAGNHKPEACR
ncbi:MAG: TlpA family protein disulfide reductase [Chloroflexi bacterium]|nr:TlpA family protein disulfide reductase [Chloroflexota bacterium]